MPERDYIAELEALGYTVGESRPGVFFVGGWGFENYFPSNELDRMGGIIDTHEERVECYESPLPPPTPPTPTLEERVEALEVKVGEEPLL